MKELHFLRCFLIMIQLGTSVVVVTVPVLADEIPVQMIKYSVLMSATVDATCLYVYKTTEVLHSEDADIKITQLYEEKIIHGPIIFERPIEGSKMFESGLERARSIIPSIYWLSTPLIFKVMDELWLESSVTLDHYFYSLKVRFASQQFYYDRYGVGFLGHNEEVLYNWYMTNYLLRKRGNISTKNNYSETKPMLYITNVATQIAFAPTIDGANYIIQNDPVHLKKVNIADKFLLYFRSYLGYGLYNARKDIITLYSDFFKNEDLIFKVSSSCIKVQQAFTWEFSGTMYSILQEQARIPERQCENIMSRFIKSMRIFKPIEINKKEIIIRSNLSDYAIKYGLARKNLDSLKVNDFTEARKRECNDPKDDRPFGCLDLTFISMLLTDGFGLHPETKLTIMVEYGGMEINWTLYYAFKLAKTDGKLSPDLNLFNLYDEEYR